MHARSSSKEFPAVIRVMANMCCRSRRSLLASLLAASLALYFIGSSVLWNAPVRKGSQLMTGSDGGAGPDGTSGGVGGGGSSANGGEEPLLHAVECVGPKCDKYMKLMGLDKSSARTKRQHCNYAVDRESAAAAAGGSRPVRRRAPATANGARVGDELDSFCRNPNAAASEQDVAILGDGSVRLRAPSDAAAADGGGVRCRLDAVRRGDNDDSVTYQLVAELDSVAAGGARKAASLKGADFHRLTCRFSADGRQQQGVDSLKAFTQYFAHVDRNEEAVADAREATCSHCLGYNVLILGVEAISQSNFQKHLPQTMDYLTAEMGAVVMRGYNAVGHSNGGTLVPMLTGQHESDLPEARRGKANSHYTDEFDIIWKDYARNGYVTLFAEDEPHRSTFNAYYHGFEMEPTNHYMRPFWLAIAKDRPIVNGGAGSKFCLGSKAKHRIALDYIEEFFEQYKDLKKLAVLHHNGLSASEGEQMALMDSDIVKLLHSLRDRGHLESTVVIVTSDHGSVDGKPAAGPKQRMDARSPALIIGVPPEFAKRFEAQAKSLQTNAGRLTTPYDVHATLLDLLDSRRFVAGMEQAVAAPPAASSSRGESLFADVAVDRTCGSAGVDAQWCTCAFHKQLAADDEQSKRAARVVVEAANAATEAYRSLCAPLRLLRIIESQWLVLSEQVADYEEQTGKTFNGSQPLEKNYIQVTIVVDDASSTVYEATVCHDSLKDTLSVTAAGVVRLSAPPAAASSHCLRDDPIAMLFCHCRS